MKFGPADITGWDWWIVLGGVLQAGGVSLLAHDVISTFRRIEGYWRRPQTIEQIHTVDADIFVPPGVMSGQQPTIEERVERLEQSTQALREELQETKADLRSEAREVATDAAAAAMRHGERRFLALEAALLGDTRTDKWRRFASIGAVVRHSRNDRECRTGALSANAAWRTYARR
jgi:hypothetical protein